MHHLDVKNNSVSKGGTGVGDMQFVKGYDVELIESLKVFIVNFEPLTWPMELKK